MTDRTNTMVQLSQIDLAPHRTRIRSTEDLAKLRQSIAERGVLQPIGVTSEGNRYAVVFGAGRLTAARELGHAEIPVMILNAPTEADAAIAAAAENMVRTPMRLTDMWQAMAHLIDQGWTAANAALSLGMTERQARQAERLGRLHPDVLALVQDESDDGDSVDMDDVAAIAMLSQEMQAELLAAATASWPGEAAIWHIANMARSRSKRASKSYALFDTDLPDITWQQDLFAEPGTPEEWTTTDLDAYRSAQLDAIERIIQRRKQGMFRLGKFEAWRCALPANFRLEISGHDNPPVMRRGGERICYLAVSDKSDFGRVHWSIGWPPVAAGQPSQATTPPADGIAEENAPADDDDASDDDGAETTNEMAKPDGRGPLTSYGQALLAKARTEALRKSLTDEEAPVTHEELAAIAVIALSSATVCVRTEHGAYTQVNFTDLAHQLVRPDGKIDAFPDPFTLLAQAVARLVGCPAAGRDNAAEWIGAAVCAITYLPRLDTPEFLATTSGDMLKGLAAEQGVKLKNVSELRSHFVGKLPEWRPDFAQFGAPGPKMRATEARP